MMLKRKQIRKPKFNRGFTLVELSASLVIIALLAGAALSVAINQNDSANITQTESKIEQIEDALVGFLVLNGRLPCPADGSLSTSDANFGLEEVTGEDCTSTAPYASDRVYAGVIPIVTLQLPDEFMFDAWGRRFTYVVDYYFASQSTGDTANNFANTDEGEINVHPYNSSSGSQYQNAVAVLISHGSNGHGGWPRGGGEKFNASSSNDAEQDNSHLDAVGAETTYDASFQYGDRKEDFDDIVRFYSKEILVRMAGAALSDRICAVADEVTEETSGNVCEGATNDGACETLATEVAKICL